MVLTRVRHHRKDKQQKEMNPTEHLIMDGEKR